MDVSKFYRAHMTGFLCPLGGVTGFNDSIFLAKATKILTDACLSSDKINAFKAAMIE